MKNKNIIIALVAIIAITAIWWTVSKTPEKSVPAETQGRSLVSTAIYACDKGKTITATYYEGTTAPKPAPGEAPIPTGSVEVSIGKTPTTTLSQTLSADGTRYANKDESLVFWSKGNTALVMRNNRMDLDYTNCATAPAEGPITVTGTVVCLPHKNTEGPQTLECAFGLKDDAGRYYGLSSADPSKIGSIPTNSRVTVEGIFAPRTESKYQDIGIITVESVKTVK